MHTLDAGEAAIIGSKRGDNPREQSTKNRLRGSTMKPSAIRLVIADDHPVVRDGVAAIIKQQADLKIVAEASNGREAIAAYEAQQPDIVLLDLRMPDMDGIKVI